MNRFIVACVAMMTGAAVAQNRPLLDLTAAPSAPAAGAGAGTLALADSLSADAANIEKSPTPDSRARAGLRLLAAALLSSGERTGQAGSARIVLGRTLFIALPVLDKLIALTPDDPTLHALNADLAVARRQIEAGGGDPDLIIRDGLALLSRLAGPAPGLGGWIDQQPAAGALNPDALAGLPGVTPEALASLRLIDQVARTNESWPAFRASASRISALAADAAAAIDSPPAWLPEPARRILGEQLSKAMESLASPDTRAAGLDDLNRLAATAQLLRLGESLEDNAIGKRIRAALAQAVAIPPSQADARTVESLTNLVTLAETGSSWPEERLLIRQLRPGFRHFSGAARQTEQALLAALPEVLRRPEAMTDPGILAAITAHKRAVADVSGLIAANTAFAAVGEGEPVADKRWQTVANRVLKLSQDLGGSRVEQRDSALASLRALFSHLDGCWPLPGESDLRREVAEAAGTPAKDRTSPWATLTGGRDAALATEITSRRAGWLAEWEKGSVGGSEAQRIEALRALMAVLHLAAPAAPPGAEYAALQTWPGWELPPTSLAALSNGLSDQVSEAARLVLAGDAAKAMETIDSLKRDFAITLLAGGLAREAAARGLAPERSASSVVRELTAGGPIRGRSWQGRHTELLDDVCRYGEEVVALRKLGAKDKADALQKFANLRAREVLDTLSPVK